MRDGWQPEEPALQPPGGDGKSDGRVARVRQFDSRDLASDLLDSAEASARLSEEELLDLIRG